MYRFDYTVSSGEKRRVIQIVTNRDFCELGKSLPARNDANDSA